MLHAFSALNHNYNHLHRLTLAMCVVKLHGRCFLQGSLGSAVPRYASRAFLHLTPPMLHLSYAPVLQHNHHCYTNQAAITVPSSQPPAPISILLRFRLDCWLPVDMY
jgi:hypothetical protein